MIDDIFKIISDVPERSRKLNGDKWRFKKTQNLNQCLAGFHVFFLMGFFCLTEPERMMVALDDEKMIKHTDTLRALLSLCCFSKCHQTII